MTKKAFPVKKRGKEHQHGILHIWNSLSTKFQFKLEIFSFDQIYPKRVFPVENRTSNLRTTSICFLCRKRSFSVCFWTFWRSQKSHVLNNLKELSPDSWALFTLTLCKAFRTALCEWPWLVKPWLNFDLRYSFKFFHKSSKFTKNKFVMVMVKRFDKYHHLFNFHILVTILFFHKYTECKGSLN